MLLFDIIYLLPQRAFCLVICAIHLKVFCCIYGHMNERRADDCVISSLLIESCFVFSDVRNLQLPTIGIGKYRSVIYLKWLICDSHLSDRHTVFLLRRCVFATIYIHLRNLLQGQIGSEIDWLLNLFFLYLRHRASAERCAHYPVDAL